MLNSFKFLTTLFSLLLLLSCDTQKKGSTDETSVHNHTIFYNGDIVTMEGDSPQYAEAVVEREGEIVFVGSKDEAFKEFEGKAKLYDLEGKTLLPGFIEPHVHPSIAGTVLPNEIIAPYDWVLPTGVKKGVSGHEAYIKRLRESIEKNAQKGELYFVWGYHPLWHGELNREMLNEIAGDQPVGVIHRSFHEIFINDATIELLEIREEDFKGNPQVNWAEGHFFEGGWLALVPMLGPILFQEDRYMEGLKAMSQLVLKNGITTLMEPGFPSSSFELEYKFLKREMDTYPPYDIFLVPNGTQLYGMKGNSNEAVKEFIETLPEEYDTKNIHFLPKQIKLFSDGAIYSQLMQMKDNYTDGHHGEWMTVPSLYQEQSKFYWDNDYKIHVHANGDLGIQMVLDDLEQLEAGHPRTDHQFTLHHMGFFTDSMAEQVAKLGAEASVNPYYLWALADKYAEHGLGPERAHNLVNINSLVSRNVPVSFHSDFAMAPMEPLTLAWTAINRVTSKNSKFSQDQRVSVFDGIRGITISAARTISQEDHLGSIKEGKTANFTLLAENPFKVEPMHIKDISIIGVVYKGKPYFNE